jgi:hypothetical protein
MAHCSNCNRSFTGKLCPKCGSPPALTPAQINKALNRHVWLILGGLFGTIAATWRYPLLDQDPVLGLALFLFFAPILIYLVLALRKRAETNPEKNIYMGGRRYGRFGFSFAGQRCIRYSPIINRELGGDQEIRGAWARGNARHDPRQPLLAGWEGRGEIICER